MITAPKRRRMVPLLPFAIALAAAFSASAQAPPADIATLEERVAQLEAQQRETAGMRLWEGFEFHGYLRSRAR